MGRHQVDPSVSVRRVHTRVHARAHGCRVFACAGVCTDTHMERLFHQEGTRVELLPGQEQGEDSLGVCGGCTRCVHVDEQQDLLYAQGPRPSVTWQRDWGAWGRRDAWTCMAEALCCPPEPVPALLISCAPARSPK